MLLGIAVLFEDLEYNSIRAYWDLVDLVIICGANGNAKMQKKQNR